MVLVVILPIKRCALAGTKHGEEGLASGVVNTSFRVGFPLGLAVLWQLPERSTPHLPELPPPRQSRRGPGRPWRGVTITTLGGTGARFN